MAIEAGGFIDIDLRMILDDAFVNASDLSNIPSCLYLGERFFLPWLGRERCEQNPYPLIYDICIYIGTEYEKSYQVMVNQSAIHSLGKSF